MKKISLIVVIMLIVLTMKSQNVGINSTGAAPAASAMLDIVSSNQGLLVPRVALTAVNSAGPVTLPATSLLVYNTATAGVSPNNVIPGYYYWDGLQWVRFAAGNGTAWTLTGNAGTTAGTNFIGTTDAVDWVIKTNNSEKMRVLSGGNVGIGITSPLYKLDVFGLGGGNIDVRTNGRFWSNSTSGGMWLSDLGDCFVGNISATQFGFWSSTVGWNALNITKSNGYVGIGTSAPTSRLHVTDNAQNIPVIYGINSNTSGGTTSFGIRGECNATGLGSAGISGVSTNSGQNEIGVVGDYSLWGAAVFGLAWAGAYTDMPSSRDFGVFGTVNFSTGTGVYGRNTNTTAGSAYGMYCMGNFAVTAAKAASLPTTKGNQLVYCQESPEIWLEDVGNSKLVNGVVEIKLDPMFMETVFIDSAHPMQVFLQENGESNGLIVIKGTDGFIVKEKNNGTSNIEFSYRVLAKRRFYQDHRFGVDANQPFEDNLSKAKYIEPATTDPMVMKAFVESETRKKEAEAAKMKANKKIN